MTAYEATEWTEFFTASAGASAALAGLVFVAVSIKVERILQFKGLPERALATVLLLLCVVLVSLIGLIPGQGRGALAAELPRDRPGVRGPHPVADIWMAGTSARRNRA